jgi:hypothetical protein
MKNTIFYALAAGIIATLTFSTHSYAETAGEKLDNTIDKINDGYDEAKENANDNYNETKEELKNEYNTDLENIKIK